MNAMGTSLLSSEQERGEEWGAQQAHMPRPTRSRSARTAGTVCSGLGVSHGVAARLSCFWAAPLPGLAEVSGPVPEAVSLPAPSHLPEDMSGVAFKSGCVDVRRAGPCDQ